MTLATINGVKPVLEEKSDYSKWQEIRSRMCNFQSYDNFLIIFFFHGQNLIAGFIDKN